MPSSGSPRALAAASSVASASAHSRQVKAPRPCSETVIAKACASHGALNTGPASSRGRAGRARRSTSGGIEVVIPQVEVHAVACGRLVPPKLACGEAHAVAMLGLLVARHRVRVGENEDAVIAVDDRSEEHTSELQSQSNLVCRLLLEKKKEQPIEGSTRLVLCLAP